MENLTEKIRPGSSVQVPGVKCLFFKRFYLFIHERQRHRQSEKQAPCREPNVGLDSVTPGSRPGRKAGAQPLSHPSLPEVPNLSGLWDPTPSQSSRRHPVAARETAGGKSWTGKAREDRQSPPVLDRKEGGSHSLHSVLPLLAEDPLLVRLPGHCLIWLGFSHCVILGRQICPLSQVC